MKRSERLMFLAGVLCAACAVTFGVVRTKEQKEKIKNSWNRKARTRLIADCRDRVSNGRILCFGQKYGMMMTIGKIHS